MHYEDFSVFCKILQYLSKAKKTIYCKKNRGVFCDAYIHQFRSRKELNRKICDGNCCFTQKAKIYNRKNNQLNCTWNLLQTCVKPLITGTLEVNDEPIYTGSSLGQFSGLDLGQNMYLGNVPDANNVPEPARFSSGYVGKKLFCLLYFECSSSLYKMWNLLNNTSSLSEKFVYTGIHIAIIENF